MPLTSTDATLYDINGNALAVQDGVAVPANTPSLLLTGKDENGNAQNLLGDSGTSALVSMDAFTFCARQSPAASVPATTPSILTRTYWGHVATAATSTVTVADSNAGSIPFLTSATTSFKIVSTSTSDAAAGTGARTILITYLGSDFVIYYVTATMNGTTVVTLSLGVSAVRVLDAFCLTTGSGLAAAGVITIKESTSTTTMAQFSSGNAQRAAQAIAVVPQGRTMLIHNVRLSAKAVAATFDLQVLAYAINTNTTTNQYVGERFRVAVGSVVPVTFAPPIAITAPSGSHMRIAISVTPDSTSAADYWASMDTSLI